MWRIRRRARARGPLPFQYVFIISFIIFILLTAQALWLVDRGIQPALMKIAETETEDIAQLAIQSAVKNRIVDSGKLDNLIVNIQDNDGKVVGVTTNPQVVNEIQALATANVQMLLEQIEQGKKPDFYRFADVDVERENEQQAGIVTEIPLGRATNNSLLANLGPSIPVRFRVIGSVQTDWVEETQTSGINNTKLRGWIHVVVKVQVVVPFQTEEKEIKTNIMLLSHFIPGEVPDYYGPGGSVQPTVPITDSNKDEKEDKKPE
ncbi:sporulation protein YunB [Pseudalkalibacillus sp. Hm43]|uniref:sporulation protein YunB n=1 Tax=Pseudalkalibacillus sp. Hm43 TaxID=3450742 RepID=UPI003F42046E